MASGAFLSLCRHLRERSDEVQNMDLMTIGGFCRNCLAKWMVLEARDLAALVLQDVELVPAFANESDYRCRGMGALLDVNNALDSFGYDEAARMVYGTTYAEWKSWHLRKATDKQLTAHRFTRTTTGVRLKTTVYTHQCKLSQRAVLRLQAGGFLRLCRHLRERSDEVQNMDLMTIGRFCRNCLAKSLDMAVASGPIALKVVLSFAIEPGTVVDEPYFRETGQAADFKVERLWLVFKARKISKETSQVPGVDRDTASKTLVESLDSFGMKESASGKGDRRADGAVQWEQAPACKARQGIARRTPTKKHCHPFQKAAPRTLAETADKPPEKRSLLSDICCQDLDAPRTPTSLLPVPTRSPIPLPAGDLDLTVGILTVSDRAASDSYETGNLSGPVVETTLATLVEGANESLENRGKVFLARVEGRVVPVPDEMADIGEALQRWSGEGSSSDESPQVTACNDLVLTTGGGAGFAPREVTPEATLSVLDRECRGLMSWASLELTAQQPLSTLSRATAGTRGRHADRKPPREPKRGCGGDRAVVPASATRHSGPSAG
ncbi:hypothetical protein ACHAWF_012759 [Thalassiosira exigua]